METIRISITPQACISSATCCGISYYIIFLRTFQSYYRKRRDTCDEKSQISPLKRQGKGSLLLPCSKMPFGIFLFALKSEFQEKPHFARKVPKNGVKRRKPEKISCFSVGIFFVNSCQNEKKRSSQEERSHPGIRLRRRYPHSAPGERAPRSSSGVCELVSLRPRGARNPGSMKEWRLQQKRTP